MQTMTICGVEYPVVGTVKDELFGTVPIVDIPMMSDFKWQLTSLEDRLADPEKCIKTFGEDVEAVIADLRQWLQEHLDQAMPWERRRFERLAA